MSYLPKNPNTKFNINYLDGTSQTGNNGIGDWVAYANTTPGDDAIPETGSGGSPNVTVARNIVDPLRGPASLLFSKDAANRQGQGISLDFKVSRADYGKPLQISFTYLIASGTFTSGDASDIRVFIYDVDNDVVIQPAPYTLQGGSLTPNDFKATFQTAVSSNDYHNYRLIFHVATTSFSSYAIRFTDVAVGPQIVNYGAPISDWYGPFPMTVSATVTAPTKGTVTKDKLYWRRVGNCMEITWSYGQSSAGTGGSGTYLFKIPNNLTIDFNQISDVSTIEQGVVGSASVFDSGGAGSLWGNVQVNSAYPQYLSVAMGNSNFGYQSWSSGFVSFLDTTLNASFSAIVPIVGWSSNVLMSNDTDTRVVAARYTTAAAFSITTTPTIINYSTKVNDTHGAVTTGSSWKYTAPVSGYYRATAQYSNFSASLKIYVLGLYKNDALYSENSATRQATNGAPERPLLSDIVYLNAGDYIDFRASTNLAGETAEANASVNFVSIERLSGPAAVAATETVAARYTTVAGQGTLNATRINYDTKVYDTHNAVTTGLSDWKFTAPVSGKYQISSAVFFAANTFAVGTTINAEVYKNGAPYSFICLFCSQTASSISPGLYGSDDIQLLAGDYIEIRVTTNNGTRNLSTTAGTNFITIKRVGN